MAIFIAKKQGKTLFFLLAEGEGFEPPEAFTSTVFKTAAFDRSANLPYEIAVKAIFLKFNSCRFVRSQRALPQKMSD